MRKFITSALVLSFLGACSSTPSKEEREEDLYIRVHYLRSALESAIIDHNAASLDVVRRELKSHARRELETFGRDLQGGPLRKKELAAFVLGFADTRKAQVWLIAATKDPDLYVSATAIAQLGFLGMVDTPLEVFRRNLSKPHKHHREAALYGIRYQLKEGETGGLLSDVVKMLRDIEKNVRNEAVIVLRRMKSKESISAITGVSLKDSDDLVRMNAALTLSAFGNEGVSAVAPLVETLRDENTKVVEAAWFALRQITGNDFDRSYDRWRDWYEEEEARYEYICLDHPKSPFNSPGQCPNCLRKLARTLRPELYLCPEHPDMQAGHEGRCSGCNRKLVAFRPVYYCPFHPDSRSILSGSCASCGKDRIAEEKIHACPTHPDVEAPRAGKCSRCEKEMAPIQK